MKMLYRVSLGLLGLCFGSTMVKAQTPGSEEWQRAMVARKIPEYLRFTGRSAPLYNGPQYAVYEHLLFSGHPFFSFPGFHNGYIVHDGIRYENIPLKFDQIKNNIVTQAGAMEMIISNDRVSRFQLLGHTFVKLTRDSAANISTGFYDEIFANERMKLYRKDLKTLRNDLSMSGGAVRKVVDSTSQFYLYIKNRYLPVNTKNQLLDALGARNAEIKQFIRRNDLRFRESDRETSLLKTITYYDSLTK